MFLKAPRLLLAAFLALSLFAASAPAQTPLIAIEVPAEGEYYLKVDAAGNVTIRPMRLIKVGTPQPPDNPDSSAFTREVASLTKSALDSGGKPTTAVAIASVYSLVADGVDSDNIGLNQWADLTKTATDAVLNKQADGVKWTEFRQRLGAALTALQAQGLLDSKKEVVDALREVSQGIKNGAGAANWNLRDVASLDRAGRDRWDREDGKADGILDGIDLAQLIELIKLIMELLKLFGGDG